MKSRIIVYPDNSVCVNGKYLIQDDGHEIMKQHGIPFKRPRVTHDKAIKYNTKQALIYVYNVRERGGEYSKNKTW